MWYFAMMKSVIQLMFVLWCGVVTSAQDNGKKKEPLRKNATSFVLPSLTAVIISRITNATTMSTPTFHSTTEPLRENATSIVRPNRTAVVGTMNTTVMSTPTFHSTTEPLGGNATSIVRPNRTAVVGTMNATVMSTPRFHSTTERMTSNDNDSNDNNSNDNDSNDNASSNFFLLNIIIICSVAVVVLLIVGTKVLLYKRTNQGTAPRRGDGEAYRRSAEEDMELKSRSSLLNTNENKVIKDAVSMNPDVVTKLIPAYGGVIDIDGFILKIGPGCLAKDTEITLIKHHDRDFAIKSLHDLGLLEAVPRVVQFLPAGLKLLKPADLTIKFENTVSDCKPFILHGSYRHDYQKTVWELVTNGIEVNNVEGIVNAKINGFSFFSLISTRCGWLDRVFSHLNQSFTCRAYTLYRRPPTVNAIDISVVLLSEFVDENEEADIKQLKYHLKADYIKGETGMLKHVHTDRRLEMSLHFPGVENTPPFPFDVNELQLDSVGFVIDYFKKIAVTSPASGEVKISEVNRSDENESLWRMNICEKKEQFVVIKEPKVIDPAEPEVVYSNTKLTKGEITRMSREVGPDWDSLAGLMDIPYSDREEIRVDCLNYPGIRPKAKKVFELFNDSTFFNRHILVKCFKELRRHDLEKEMLPVNQNGEVEPPPTREVEPPPTPPVLTEDLLRTRLSAREMSKLGQRIVQWEQLAGLMNIPRAVIDELRYSLIYHDNRARAEKILSIFNNVEGFSRRKLAGCLEEIQRLDLVEPVSTGKWRNLYHVH